MVLRILCASVPGPQTPGEHLPATGREQRVETEPTLVMAGCELLLGMDADRGRVEIKDHPARGCSCLPRPSSCHGASLTDPVDLRLPDREQHPTRRGNRGQAPEQRRLAGQRG